LPLLNSLAKRKVFLGRKILVGGICPYSSSFAYVIQYSSSLILTYINEPKALNSSTFVRTERPDEEKYREQRCSEIPAV
jgi:hypothetical protein